MALQRKTGWRLAAGTLAASSLTSTYNIVDIALQSDQTHVTPWTIDSAGTLPPKHARIVQNADESLSGDGFYHFQWRMSYMTHGMLSYWLTTFLPGGVKSADVTVLTYDETDTAMYLTAKLWKPEFPSGDAQYAIGGWGSVIWRFRTGVQIFP